MFIKFKIRTRKQYSEKFMIGEFYFAYVSKAKYIDKHLDTLLPFVQCNK